MFRALRCVPGGMVPPGYPCKGNLAMDWLTFVQSIADRSDGRTAEEYERSRKLEAVRRMLAELPDDDDSLLSSRDARDLINNGARSHPRN